MEPGGKIAVITGGASGIGAALAAQMIARGARVTIADLDEKAVKARAAALGCAGHVCDVRSEADIVALIETVREDQGEVDIFVSNAGLFAPQPGHAASAPDTVWHQNWAVHVMAHVYAARALLPGMIERGSGYFVNVASAAGLLNQVGNAAYSASKHAAVSFAESLAISHGDQGIGVSVVCPQYVATPLIGLKDADAGVHASLLTAAEVAEVILDAVSAERFMVLPHGDVAAFFAKRAADPERWIAGMRLFNARAQALEADGDLPAYYSLL
ncbi:SDR family NAD(P)-dependent oxidoreductase [Roseobacter sp.]|uniref:SDR family NAD(P)-dependent oxidoreductase n=1 Tax=Roseobacter sp. TaxID=1907202 RepID=UPI0025E833CC|nr:SDR family NAD(P)-dependent oxidoreductase [Roseobacter sp.]